MRRRVLFLENEDSFSWNVIDRLPFDRREIAVVPGRRAAADPAALDGVEAVLVGPGPTDPVRAGLVAFVAGVARSGIPLLGICLGHQALGLAFGARLAPVLPAHGRVSTATFEPSRLFPGVRGPRPVMRYHSLALQDVPPPLRVVARSDDALPMAIEHDSLPLAGLQFHPDSYATPGGGEILASFFRAVL